MTRVCLSVWVCVLLAASGCGSTTTAIETVTVTESPAAETVAEPPATQAAAPDYSGTGTMTLAPTSYPAGADVEWTCSDCFVFFLIALRGPIDTPPQMIVSEEHSGTGYIPPGNYTLKVSTSASGDWTMNVTPR